MKPEEVAAKQAEWVKPAIARAQQAHRSMAAALTELRQLGEIHNMPAAPRRHLSLAITAAEESWLWLREVAEGVRS